MTHNNQPNNNQPTSLVSLTQLIEKLDLQGEQLAHLLTQCQIPLDLMENPKLSLTLSQEHALVRQLISQSQNPQLGLIAGQCYRLNSFGSLGLAATSVACFKDAIELFIQFIALTYTPFKITLGVIDNWAYIEFEEKTPLADLYTYYRDRDISFAITAIKDIYPPAYSLTKKKLQLIEAETEDSQIYQDFLACPVQFKQRHNRFLFDKKALDIPLPQANKFNLKILTAQCEELLEDIQQSQSYSDFIYSEILARSNNQIAKQEEIADKLKTTTRTIRRKLAQEGYTFQQLLKKAQQERAYHLLENSKLSIEDIADKIGYSESAAFIRAFKSWSGKTPLQVRRGYRVTA